MQLMDLRSDIINTIISIMCNYLLCTEWYQCLYKKCTPSDFRGKHILGGILEFLADSEPALLWWSHWASMLRWIWPIVECNLKTRDSQKWPRKRWPLFCGNVEWADLKQNNQSITHIDPASSVSGKGPSLRLNGFSSILAKSARFMQSDRPITSPLSMSFSRLVTTTIPHIMGDFVCAAMSGDKEYTEQ